MSWELKQSGVCVWGGARPSLEQQWVVQRKDFVRKPSMHQKGNMQVLLSAVRGQAWQ